MSDQDQEKKLCPEPAVCAERIGQLTKAVETMTGEIRLLNSPQGPLVTLDRRVTVVEESSKSAHHRLDNIERAPTESNGNRKIAMGFGGGGIAAGLLYIIVKLIEKIGGGG